MQRRTSATTFGALTTAALAGLATLTTLAPPASAAPAVHVTEIHYDNTGTDTGEAIEVTGPAGTDLTGWSLVLYTGSNGTVYDTKSLTGVIDDEDAALGAVAVDVPGLQNGAPDGLALVDDTGAVVEFLSYEGDFTAVGGPADGMTSTDIGASEGGSDPLGYSLQYLDGAWTPRPPVPSETSTPRRHRRPPAATPTPRSR